MKGEGPDDCLELIISEGAELLLLSGLEKSEDVAKTTILKVLKKFK